MRKLLLATVAALGASMAVASYADAQVVDDTDGQSFPTPGTVTVRLNGRYRFYAYVADQGAGRTTNYGLTGPTACDHRHGTPSARRRPPAASTPAPTGWQLRLRRLRPAVSRLRRRRRERPEVWCLARNPAGQHVRRRRRCADGSITGNDRTRGILYLRREWGYIGTDRLGTIRLGSTDQPTSLYMTAPARTSTAVA